MESLKACLDVKVEIKKYFINLLTQKDYKIVVVKA